MAKENPWYTWFFANDYMANEHIGTWDWEKAVYGPNGDKGNALVDGHSSHNKPVVAAVVGALLNPGPNRIWDEWKRYFHLPWMAGEPASRHVYGDWILGSILAIWAIARASNHGDVANLARLNLRATASWLALGAAGMGTGEWGRSYVTITGARSAVSEAGEDGKRYDKQGYANPIYHIEKNNLESLLDVLLGYSPQKIKTWLDSKYATDPPVRRYGLFYDRVRLIGKYTGIDCCLQVLTNYEKETLAKVVSGDTSRLKEVAGWLSAVPGPNIPLVALKRTGGTVSLALKSIRHSSTYMLYGLGYYLQGLPHTWQSRMKWPTLKPILWLAA
ncbi:MAG: hypothetical protein ACYSW3_30290, partial [Planctomycetota bacterium]